MNLGKIPMLSSSYRPISLFDAVGKLVEKFIFTRILGEVNKCRLLHDEQFGFQTRHSTMLRFVCLDEVVNRNFDERRLTNVVFLDVNEVFDTIQVRGLLYKPTIVNFQSYLVKTVSLYLDCQMFQTSFQSAISKCHHIWAGVPYSGLVSPVLCCM
jgi:hypothetical protein